MRLAQITLPAGGPAGRPVIHAAVVEGDAVFDIANDAAQKVDQYIVLASDQSRPLMEVIGAARHASLSYSFAELAAETSDGRPRLTLPICPPEVWGCGVTYKKSAEFRDEDASQTTRGIYDQVYTAARPEIFFKGTTSRCVGPNEPIGIRSDSVFTAPEPELALVLNRAGEIVGFTVANDVSAWDIERENPLYLPQSKIFQGCCALGPVIVTPDELGDGGNLLLSCRIRRAGKVTFAGEVSTSRIGRSFAELIEYLRRDNPIPDGTVVCTGTGVIAPAENALAEGDVVEIEIEGIGRLANPAIRLLG